MSNPRSLAFQASCWTHILSLHEKTIDPEVLAAARQGIRSLEYLSKREALLKELIRLEREAPDIFILVQQLPGIQISDVRFHDEQREAAE